MADLPCVLNGFWLAATCEDEFSGNATSYACMDVKVRLVNSMQHLDAASYCSYNITCEDRLG
jgi:hypothetical protein